MAVSHASLTGADLHEPKGVASQAAGKVYISDGAGSGAWTTLPNPVDTFGTKGLLIWEQYSSGTNGGLSFTGGSWQTRNLNQIEYNNISGSSLASKQVTLPAGNYYIQGYAEAIKVDTHQTAWYNVTDASYIISGTSGYAHRDNFVHSISNIHGYFTIAGTKVFELRHRGLSSYAYGFGVPVNFGLLERFANVQIWKLP